jgi:addiction module HigA family antidote
MNEKLLEPIFPGEILNEEFMRPLDISIERISKELSLSQSTLSDIIAGKKAITAEIALKLGEYFGVSPDLWLGLQTEYELRLAKYQISPFPERSTESEQAYLQAA